MKTQRHVWLKILFSLVAIVGTVFFTEVLWYPYYVKTQVSQIKRGMKRYDVEKNLREIKPKLSEFLLSKLRGRLLVCGSGLGPPSSYCKEGKCNYTVIYCGAWFSSWPSNHIWVDYEWECKKESCSPPGAHVYLSSGVFSERYKERVNDMVAGNILITDRRGEVLYQSQ